MSYLFIYLFFLPSISCISLHLFSTDLGSLVYNMVRFSRYWFNKALKIWQRAQHLLLIVMKLSRSKPAHWAQEFLNWPTVEISKSEGYRIKETTEHLQNAIWVAFSSSQSFNLPLGIYSYVLLAFICIKCLFFPPWALLLPLKFGSRNYHLPLSVVIFCPLFPMSFISESLNALLTGHLDPNLCLL